MIRKSATFSSIRTWRYTLSRIWIARKPFCFFVCLTPSTADENVGDPTIRRCIGFAESFGCGGMAMVNLFAFRATDPDKLLTADDPVGPENDIHVRQMSSEAGITITAWGAHKMIENRAADVLKMLSKPMCLAKTSAGNPCHPLYLKKTLKPIPFHSDGSNITLERIT